MECYGCTKTFHYLLFLLAWLIPLSLKYAACGISLHDNMLRCIAEEREALLQFKKEIQVDSCDLLTSWDVQEGGQLDCCQWRGIRCHDHSGHVINLDLGWGGDFWPPRTCLQGRISPSILELKHLKYLDLSSNYFLDQPIPSFIGSLHRLKYLNLSNAGFEGEIPHHLANLSSLTSLDLSSDDYGGLYVKSLRWLPHLTLLKDFNLSGVDLSLATNWLRIVNGLPFLRSLHLDSCSLPPPIMASLLSYENSSTTLHAISLQGNILNDSSIFQWVFNLTGTSNSLAYLDLSDNSMPGPFPSAFGNTHSLSYLDLSGNSLEGLVPGSISKLKLLQYLDLSGNNFQGIHFSNSLCTLCSLQTIDLSNNNIADDFPSILQFFSGCANKSLVSLDVSNNHFWGSIPHTMGLFSSLEQLNLRSNQLNGTITPSLGQLSRLEWLDFSSNSLRGTLSNHHLSNLSRLSFLDLSHNLELVLDISANWVPPFQLGYIALSSCELGPSFPKWLLTQMNFFHLDISNTRICDTIPASFWNSLQPNLQYLNLSHNGIYGMLPNPSMTFNSSGFAFPAIDLSSNLLEGAIPSFLGYVGELFLNDNYFSGSIGPFCPKTKSVLLYLDLSNNYFSGELPDCWENFEQLQLLRLNNNNFTGKLPLSIGALNELQWLSLRNNDINGELKMFKNCTSLAILDLGYNSFTGYVPPGIGNTLKTLVILDLRRNKLFGRLPVSLCQLTSLQILDLSLNHISGTIPKCICNLQGMKNSADIMVYIRSYYGRFLLPEMIMWKREEQSFSRNLGPVRSISISDNELEGEIPRGILCLIGLASLDLAGNNLTGPIPSKIGELTSLEFLDLSSNRLSGDIPSSLANLNFLGTLNLSYNNLSGKIPTSTQLQGMDPAAYTGNPGLCGAPLLACVGGLPPRHIPKGDNITREEENDRTVIFPGLYISVVLGFIVGFWGVCGTLVIKRSWRHAYFRFVEDMYDRLYVMVAVYIARVWRRP